VKIIFFVNVITGSKKINKSKAKARLRRINKKYLLKFETGGNV
jgi:hypothetical protein